MNKLQLIAAIRLATGKPIADVAKDHGYSKHSFYRAINNQEYCSRSQELIASIIGKPVDQIWPEKFNRRADDLKQQQTRLPARDKAA